jgi:hypothetical protein
MSEGGPGRSLTGGEGGDGTRLAPYMKYLDREEARHTVAEVWGDEKLYIFLGRWSQSWAEDSQDGHPHTVQGSDMLTLNYETGSWWPWRFRTLTAHHGGELQPALAIKAVIDLDGEKKLLCSYRAAVNHFLAPNYTRDDLMRRVGQADVRVRTPIEWNLGMPELFQAGALFGPRRLGLAGLLHRWPLGLTLRAYRGGRYLPADELVERLHTYEPDLTPYPDSLPPGTTLGRDNDYEWFNIGKTRIAVPRLFVSLEWLDQFAGVSFAGIHPIVAPPMLTGATLEVTAVNRKKRPI